MIFCDFLSAANPEPVSDIGARAITGPSGAAFHFAEVAATPEPKAGQLMSQLPSDDSRFTSADLDAALQTGTYRRAVVFVPEPQALGRLSPGLLLSVFVWHGAAIQPCGLPAIRLAWGDLGRLTA